MKEREDFNETLSDWSVNNRDVEDSFNDRMVEKTILPPINKKKMKNIEWEYEFLINF